MHDTIIADFTEELIIEPCLRKYPELEEILCFGCHPLEQSFIDTDNMKLYICEDFAMKIWKANTPEDLTKPTTRFDNCGLKISDGDLLQYADGKSYILPSVIPDFLQFINGIKIPLYEDYTIEIRTGDKTKCYTNIRNFIQSINVVMYIIIMILLT